METQKKFSYSQLRQYTKPENAHVAYRGKVYNISSFLGKHPGGKETLLMAAGSDITPLFEAYHRSKTFKLLNKFYVGELTDHEMPTFGEMGEFYKTLRNRVFGFFDTNNIDPKVDYSLFLFYGFVVFLTCFSYFLMMFWSDIHLTTKMVLSVITGFGTGYTMYILHDASHFSITHKPCVWKALECIGDIIVGGYHYTWRYRHTYGHHCYPNIVGADPEINSSCLLNWSDHLPSYARLNFNKKWFPHYVLQYIYMPFLYCLFIIGLRIDDTMSVFNLRYANTIRINSPTHKEILLFALGKAAWVLLKIVIPLVCLHWKAVVLLMLISDVCTSVYLVVVLAPNHLNENTRYYSLSKGSKKIEKDWAELQVECSFDYLPESTFWSVIAGGVNNQISHHLFPGILSIHYPKIAPIVKKTCKEFGIQYKCLNSFSGAFIGHLKHLRQLGQKDNKES